MTWDPQLYNRFESERAAPFLDLMALVKVRPGMRVVDLGCGPGSLTARLAEALPESDVLGIDSSAEMLAKAVPRPGLRFELGRLEDLEGTYDLVFSHAMIHWVDDHEELIPRLWEHVAPGGQLAVQMPSNHTHPVHMAILAVASEEPYRTALHGFMRRSPLLPLRRYAELLYELGASEQDALEKVYPHVLEDAPAMVEWVRGTTMVPYLERLAASFQGRFVERCLEKVRLQYPGSPVFFGFNRILLWGQR
jgi:trans-aconitate 2-methyltransferase